MQLKIAGRDDDKGGWSTTAELEHVKSAFQSNAKKAHFQKQVQNADA